MIGETPRAADADDASALPERAPDGVGGGDAAFEKTLQVPTLREIGGRDGPEPTRFGDWEKNGRCIDF
jgi:hypothetical protein